MYNVLIVDDSEDIRALVRSALEDGPYELFEAINGEDALEQARIIKPALVVLDVMMPGRLDGYETCAIIKQDDTLRRSRVLLLTARDHQTDLHRGRLSGCDAYMMKPFSPAQLARTASQLVRPRELPALS